MLTRQFINLQFKKMVMLKCANFVYNRIIIHSVITKVIKMPSWKAWVQRPSGLIKMREEAQAL